MLKQTSTAVPGTTTRCVTMVPYPNGTASWITVGPYPNGTIPITSQHDATLNNIRLASHWEEIAMKYQSLSDFYRAILLEIALHLGDEVYLSDTGRVHDEPLMLKIPDMVAKLKKQLTSNP